MAISTDEERMKKIITIIIFLSATVFAQKGQYGFTIEGGMNFPTGDFNNFYNPEFGGFGGLFYNFSDAGRVTATVGYNGWSLDLDALNQSAKENGNTGSYNIEAPISAIPILINVKYFLRSSSQITPYIMLEGGIYKITREIYGQYIDENNNSDKITPQTDNSTDGSINLGMGIEYPINEIMNFNFSARYHFILNKSVHNLGDYGYSAEYSTNNFFSLSAGLNIFFE